MIAYGGHELANSFRTVRKNTLQIAEDIPESQYGFAPAPGARTVGGLLAHIAFGWTFYEDLHRVRHLDTLEGYDFAAFGAAMAAREREPRGKADLIGLLQREGEAFATWVASLSPEFLGETFTDPTGAIRRTRFESLLSVKEHEMHHRGQLMVIERMLGIVPHLTRAREARTAAHAGTAGQASLPPSQPAARV